MIQYMHLQSLVEVQLPAKYIQTVHDILVCAQVIDRAAKLHTAGLLEPDT
jgi:hypothetical protein